VSGAVSHDVRELVRGNLYEGLPEADTPEIYKTKTDAVFQHVYESYYGADRSVYSAAA